MKSIYEKIGELNKQNKTCALCTIVSTSGSVPRKHGAKMLVLENGKIFGSVGGGALEKKVIEDALFSIETNTPQLKEHALVYDHGMCCGGKVTIFIEPIMSQKKLYIFGAGHIGRALAKYSKETGFNVSLIDERPSIINSITENHMEKLCKPHYKAFQELKYDKNTYVAVITHDHAYDREIVAFWGNKDIAYLGMIGSARKIEIAKKVFIKGEMLSEEQMEFIDWPMGLDIGAKTPEEIAISILSKMIQVRALNNKKLITPSLNAIEKE